MLWLLSEPEPSHRPEPLCGEPHLGSPGAFGTLTPKIHELNPLLCTGRAQGWVFPQSLCRAGGLVGLAGSRRSRSRGAPDPGELQQAAAPGRHGKEQDEMARKGLCSYSWG